MVSGLHRFITLCVGVASVPGLVVACAPGTGSAPDQQYPYGNGGHSNAQGGGASDSGVPPGQGGGNPGGGNPGGGNPGGGSPGGGSGNGGFGNSGGVPPVTGGTFGGGGTIVGGGGTGVVFDAGSDPSRNDVLAGHVCDRLATVQCAGEAACCFNPGRTFDQCYQAQLNACVNTAYLDKITLNSVAGYDPIRASAAFAEFERLASLCDPTVAAWGISINGLRGIVAGTKAPGSTCSPSSILDKSAAAAALASCTNGDTTACLPAAIGAWTCAARGGVGGTCFTDVNCQDGLYCTNPGLSLPGPGTTCQFRKPDGQACGGGNECSSLMCRGGTCVPADQQAAYCIQ